MDQERGRNALPLGFSFALAMDPAAMESFTAMSEEKRMQIAQEAKQKTSKQDMQALVDSISNDR
ncbi:MAG: hypothetical protein IJO56_06055 [Oscillospiraceae bacterium]|nr:hypothetical protein [Oscillospiraceae bacterium]